MTVGALALDAGVPRRHPDRDVLVGCHDVLDRGVGQRLGDREFRRPGVAEQVVDAVLLQGLDEVVGARAGRAPAARVARRR
jgi:hypothetical protein